MLRALISVWDKTGIDELALRLHQLGFEIVSTGGTGRALRDAGIPVRDVSDVTGFPEVLDGRVKTLHPAIHAGLLALRDDPEHMKTMENHGFLPVDLVVSNLYPFESVVGAFDTIDAVAIENIDIGGPAMVRAAAKNHASVVVLVDPGDYTEVMERLATGGLAAIDQELRRSLAAKAFEHVSTYDALVAAYLRPEGSFPLRLPIGAKLIDRTRYGENPHQRGAVYAVLSPGPPAGVATWEVVDGREMSYNNYLDASSAWVCATSFARQVVVIIKHTLPCGIGESGDQCEAYRRALAGDPVSAFGGILSCNRPITAELANEIGRHRFDVMIAPDFEEAALERLRRKRNLRLIRAGTSLATPGFDIRSIPGGLLVQEQDAALVDQSAWTCVTDVVPTSEQLTTLAFAWNAVRFVKSNGIVLAKPGAVVGIGAGQPNRVESVRIAVRVAGESAVGSCLASDAFFPFPDGVEAAAQSGIAAIAQSGGSVRDAEVISVANKHGIAMMFTGTRHFRH